MIQPNLANFRALSRHVVLGLITIIAVAIVTWLALKA